MKENIRTKKNLKAAPAEPLTELLAVSPVDGRYHAKTSALSPFFSEFALLKYRVQVEVEYFLALTRFQLPPLRGFSQKNAAPLRRLYTEFSVADAQRIKEIEKRTNHDVKAVEYFLKEHFQQMKLGAFSEFIHFGLTSQDINNTAVPLSLKEATHEVYLPKMEALLVRLEHDAKQWSRIPLLARTHGQPASPTTLGKEIYVFVYRLKNQLKDLGATGFYGKFGGATGNLNAHRVAFPKKNWKKFADDFLQEVLGLQRNAFTTQIDNYDQLAARLDALKRINTILIDLCRDLWAYISMDYFKQKIKAGEIGSSAMPHKVNPIDFENAEGNLGLANALLEHLSAKLPVSRLQRDLTDSTVLRNLGVPFAHMLIALDSLQKGWDKLLLNEEALHQDLDQNWAVVAEAIQTILRRENFPEPYETLKALTRKNEKISAESIRAFIQELPVSPALKKELLAITPFNYTGYTWNG